MKKIIALILVLPLLIMTYGCGKQAMMDKNYARNVAVGATVGALGAYVVYDLVSKNTTTTGATTTTTTTSTTGSSTSTTTATTTTTAGSAGWSTKASMPTGRSYLAAAAANSKIYAVGGMSGSTDFDEIEEYNPTTDTWSAKTHKAAKNHGSGIGLVNSKLYIIGGLNSNSSAFYDTVEEYDPAANTFGGAKASMPIGRAYFGATVVDQAIFALGGQQVSVPTAEVDAYEADTWNVMDPLPAQLDNFACVTVTNEIYVIGGFDATSTRVSTVRAYNLDSGSWSTKAPISAPRSGMAAAVYNNKIYIFGGHSDTDPVNLVEVYDPATNSWSAGPAMTTTRQGAAAVTVGTTIYVIGGDQGLGAGNVGLTVVEAFTP
jgi:N-acetylneuraminic acid mutarotase